MSECGEEIAAFIIMTIPTTSKMKSILLSMGALCIASTSGYAQDVHSLADVGHEFSFYADGRFQNQYLSGEKGMRSWSNLYDVDPSNLNLLIFLGCERRVSYNDKDKAYVAQFLKDGGAIFIAGQEGNIGQNALAATVGASFGPAAKLPYQATDALKKIAPDVKDIEGHRSSTLILKNPAKWTVLVSDSTGAPVIAQRRVGKGSVIMASRSLFGSNPNGKDNINAAWVSPMLKAASANKPVDPAKRLPDGSLNASKNKNTVNGITYYYSDYLKSSYDCMVDISNTCLPLIEKRMGVPLSEGMGASIGLLATDGGGFSSGAFVGLAVFWEDFPKVQHGMYEFLTHEFVHSWVLPHPEISNEPIATYVGDLVMGDGGYKEEGDRRIKQNIARASRIDPTMKLYDINGNGTPELSAGQKNEIHWGKSFWVYEEMRKLDADFMAKYFQAKRKYVPARLSARYSWDDTVAIISKALEKDMFPWFNEYGMPCKPEAVNPAIQKNLKAS